MTTPQTFFDHFTDGVAAGRPGEPTSLAEDSARWNQASAGPYHADSVLSQWRMSSNGMSERDYDRMAPNGDQIIPSQGASEGTLQSQVPLRVLGDIQ